MVPKALRDAMRLQPGQKVNIVFADGRLEIVVPVTPARLVRSRRGSRAQTDEVMPTLRAEVVRDVLEEVRR